MPEIIEARKLRGVQRLAGAVLVQAIEDLNDRWGRTRGHAMQWIADRREGQFSFVYCCRMMSRNPDEMRRALLGQVLTHCPRSAKLNELEATCN